MRIVDFSKLMIMGVFEGANKADFSDATELYKITKNSGKQNAKDRNICRESLSLHTL